MGLDRVLELRQRKSQSLRMILVLHRELLCKKTSEPSRKARFWLYGRNGDFVRAVIDPDKSEGEMVDVAQTKKWKINLVDGGERGLLFLKEVL